MRVPILPISYNTAVEALLSGCNLPTEDLAENQVVQLFGLHIDEALVGVVGLELYGETALLRSLAVTDSIRRTGLGVALTSFAEERAVASGAKAVYLLTTTAESFFAHRGYVRARRQEAPPAIASTSQFSELCPASSAFMVKRYDGQHTAAGNAASLGT